MTLGELIARLAQEPADKVVRDGFGSPHSYRGDYSELAFEPAENVTVESMLAHARSALGKTFEGYKGGSYHMAEYTSCYIAAWGDWNGSEDDLTRRRLDEMLSEDELTALRATIAEQAATIARLEGELALSHQRLDETRILLDVAMGQREQTEAERDALTARVAAALELIVEAQHKGQSDDPDVCHVTQAWFDDLTAALKEQP